MNQPEHRGFKRFVFQLEVELGDPVAAAAYTMDVAEGEDGEIGLSPHPTAVGKISAAVVKTIATALSAESERGFKFMSGGLIPWPTDDAGKYTEFVLPAPPNRRPDGTLGG